MPTLFRWMLRLAIFALALFVGIVALAWYFASRSLPEYEETFTVAGLTAPVEIVRTTEAVPHIIAQTDEDGFYALGLVHAQDRLFQMEMLRRAAEGRLAEVLGPVAAPTDDIARRMEFARLGRAAVTAQDEATRAALRAYSAGVNAWLHQVNLGARGRGAPEFFVRSASLTYWEPADSLAILKLMAAGASTALPDEILRARLSLAAPGRGPQIVGDMPAQTMAELFPNARFPAPISQPMPPRDAYLLPGMGMGGQVFAAGPEQTASGGAVLANDPGLGISAPGLFYLARLAMPSADVIGATIPGMPLMLTGRSKDRAWGIVPAGIDDVDVVMEEVQPGQPDRYRSQSGWQPFELRRERLQISGRDPVTITLRSTDAGPVLSGSTFGLAAATPAGHVAAMVWTGSKPEDTSMSALMGLMRADNREAARTALGLLIAPALDIALADDDGVVLLRAGAVPSRRSDTAAIQNDGLLPRAGYRPGAGWDAAKVGVQAREPLNGQSGIVAAGGVGAAHEMISDRLTRMFSLREIHSRDSFIDTQLDMVSAAARRLLPPIGANLWFTGEPAPAGTPERQRQDALALLAEWDGTMSEHLPEPLIYAAWMAQLQNRLIRDEIGPLADDVASLQPDFLADVFRNRSDAAAWCDVAQSAPVEDCTTLARQALDAALLDLTEEHGRAVESWRWGDAHVATHRHPALGRIAGLEWVVNLVQSLPGGDATLARGKVAGRGADRPFGVVSAPGYRGVYDLADPDGSVYVLATGQSGHPFSRHYDDQSELWRRGEYLTMSFDLSLARAAAEGITRLEPDEAP